MSGNEEKLSAALKFIAKATDRTQAWMRKHGVKFDDLDAGWQKIAFSIYMDLVEVAERARHALEEYPDQQGETHAAPSAPKRWKCRGCGEYLPRGYEGVVMPDGVRRHGSKWCGPVVEDSGAEG